MSNISTVYFRKLFTKTFGISPIKYLKKIRMQKAKELLMADSGSISDIARLTGFTSISTFSKVFKAENGFRQIILSFPSTASPAPRLLPHPRNSRPRQSVWRNPA